MDGNLNLRHYFDNYQPTGRIYNNSLIGFSYTDGIRELVKKCECAWLVGDAAFRCKMLSKWDPFVVVTYIKYEGYGIGEYSDGNGKVLDTVRYEYGRFPMEGITMWFENQTLYLPSEH